MYRVRRAIYRRYLLNAVDVVDKISRDTSNPYELAIYSRCKGN